MDKQTENGPDKGKQAAGAVLPSPLAAPAAATTTSSQPPITRSVHQPPRGSYSAAANSTANANLAANKAFSASMINDGFMPGSSPRVWHDIIYQSPEVKHLNFADIRRISEHKASSPILPTNTICIDLPGLAGARNPSSSLPTNLEARVAIFSHFAPGQRGAHSDKTSNRSTIAHMTIASTRGGKGSTWLVKFRDRAAYEEAREKPVFTVKGKECRIRDGGATFDGADEVILLRLDGGYPGAGTAGSIINGVQTMLLESLGPGLMEKDKKVFEVLYILQACDVAPVTAADPKPACVPRDAYHVLVRTPGLRGFARSSKDATPEDLTRFAFLSANLPSIGHFEPVYQEDEDIDMAQEDEEDSTRFAVRHGYNEKAYCPSCRLAAGHVSAECPEKICRKCDDKGHDQFNCPQGRRAELYSSFMSSTPAPAQTQEQQRDLSPTDSVLAAIGEEGTPPPPVMPAALAAFEAQQAAAAGRGHAQEREPEQEQEQEEEESSDSDMSHADAPGTAEQGLGPSALPRETSEMEQENQWHVVGAGRGRGAGRGARGRGGAAAGRGSGVAGPGAVRGPTAPARSRAASLFSPYKAAQMEEAGDGSGAGSTSRAGAGGTESPNKKTRFAASVSSFESFDWAEDTAANPNSAPASGTSQISTRRMTGEDAAVAALLLPTPNHSPA